MTRYECRVDPAAVSAIDVHVHVERGADAHGHDHLALDQELMDEVIGRLAEQLGGTTFLREAA